MNPFNLQISLAALSVFICIFVICKNWHSSTNSRRFLAAAGFFTLLAICTVTLFQFSAFKGSENIVYKIQSSLLFTALIFTLVPLFYYPKPGIASIKHYAMIFTLLLISVILAVGPWDEIKILPTVSGVPLPLLAGSLVLFFTYIAAIWFLVTHSRKLADSWIKSNLYLFIPFLFTASTSILSMNMLINLKELAGIQHYLQFGITFFSTFLVLILHELLHDPIHANFKKFSINLLIYILVLGILFYSIIIIKVTVQKLYSHSITGTILIALVSGSIIFLFTWAAQYFIHFKKRLNIEDNCKELLIIDIADSISISSKGGGLIQAALESFARLTSASHCYIELVHPIEGKHIYSSGGIPENSLHSHGENEIRHHVLEHKDIIIRKELIFSNMNDEINPKDLQKRSIDLIIPLYSNDMHFGELYCCGTGSKSHTCNSCQKTIQDILIYALTAQSTHSHDAEDQARSFSEKIVKGIKDKIIPQTIEQTKRIGTQAFNISCSNLGGDFYTSFKRKNSLCLFLADMSYNGILSARSFLYTYSLLEELEKHYSAGEMLNHLNSALLNLDVPPGIAAQCLVLDNSGHGQWAGAGTAPPYILNTRGQLLQLEFAHSMPLGIDRANNYTNHEFILEPGTTGLLCNDGLFETINSSGERYSSQKVELILEKYRSSPLHEKIEALYLDVTDFMKTEKQISDKTALLFSY